MTSVLVSLFACSALDARVVDGDKDRASAIPVPIALRSGLVERAVIGVIAVPDVASWICGLPRILRLHLAQGICSCYTLVLRLLHRASHSGRHSSFQGVFACHQR